MNGNQTALPLLGGNTLRPPHVPVNPPKRHFKDQAELERLFRAFGIPAVIQTSTHLFDDTPQFIVCIGLNRVVAPKLNNLRAHVGPANIIYQLTGSENADPS